MISRKLPHIGFLALLFGLLSLLFYRHTITLGPAFHHAWAQADRFSLALNFVNNGLDLFHPATHNLLTVKGITGVEFPIHNYLVAVIMKLTGTTAPWVFRSFTLLCSCVGLGFLYFLTLRITRSAIKAAVVVVFVFCSPVYAFYQASFLPSVFSFSTALIGYYFFYQYRKTNKPSAYYLAVLLLTVAAASRAPFAVFVIASLAHQVLYCRWTKANILRNALTYAAAFAFLIAYFLYNEYLNHTYKGSMFLTRPMAFRSVQEALETIRLASHNWALELLSLPQWIFLLLAVLGCIWQLRKQSVMQLVRHEFLVHFAIATFGMLCYSFLMGRQFIHHDYYLIDSWFPILVFLLVGALHHLPAAFFRNRLAATAALVVVAGTFVFAGYQKHQQRYIANPTDRFNLTRLNFEGSEQLLDSLQISPDARMLVLDAYSFNLPLLLMNRRGYTQLTTSEKGISDALKWDFDYVVVQKDFFFSDVVTNYPLITSLLRPVGENSRIAIWERNPTPPTIAGQWKTTLEGNPDTLTWTNQAMLRPGTAFSGKQASRLGATDTYSFGFRKTAADINLKPGQKLIVSGQVFFEEQWPAGQLVISLECGGKPILWTSTPLSKVTLMQGRWNKVSVLADVPEHVQPACTLRAFLMKENPAILYLDDLEVLLLESTN